MSKKETGIELRRMQEILDYFDTKISEFEKYENFARILQDKEREQLCKSCMNVLKNARKKLNIYVEV